jgi:DNA-binding transcriptional regulator PaaX
VLFDIPTEQNTQRSQLRRNLRGKHFGCLQDSVWITPDPLKEEARLLGSTKIDVKSVILLEARPCAGESDADVVAGAWNFARINRLYSQHLKILGEKPGEKLNNKGHATALRQWAEAERLAWREAVKWDPLLPHKLLPSGYMGRRAWQQRIEVLGNAKRDLQTFSV